MLDEQVQIGLRTKQLQNNFKGLLSNCPKMPSPKSQIIQIYKNYLSVHQMQDRSGRLKQKILGANQQSIYKEFVSYMHRIFFDLDKEYEDIKYPRDLNKLDRYIQDNFPTFIQTSPNNKHKIDPLTPGNGPSQAEQAPLAEQQKIDMIFSYLFDKLHSLLINYKQYYQLQKADYLQNAIYQGFYNYSQQNQFSFLNRIDQKSSSKTESEGKVVRFQGSQSQKMEGKDKSVFMDELMDIVVENLQDKKAIKKLEQETQQKRKSLIKGIKLGKYEINPLQIFGNAYSIFQSFNQKSLPKALAHVFNTVRSKGIKNSMKSQDDEEQQKKALQLAEVILKSHLKHNVSKEAGLCPDQFKLVEQYLDTCKSQGFQMLNFRFSQDQKLMLIQLLTQVINSTKMDPFQEDLGCKLQQFLDKFLDTECKDQKQESKICSKLGSRKGIKTTLSSMNTLSQLPNLFYLVVSLFRTFEGEYHPRTRRLILRIVHQIEQTYKNSQVIKEYRKFSLTHTLKLLESHKIQRTQVCRIITNQVPFRQSQLPLENQKEEYFQDDAHKKKFSIKEAQLHLEHQLHSIHVFQHNKEHKQPAKMQFLKLSHSTNKKNVTILVSGFLSQDTNKFQEWMGMLEPTYDSEIYALKWESKTIENILEYTIGTCKDIVLAGAGAGMIGGPYVKAAFILKQIFNKYNQNPFNPCFQVATITGIFFADLIMRLFEGHFINLVGFSLGTQVIASALDQFKKKNKLHMINRVVTMGGVADKKYLFQVLDKVEESEQNPISIAWTNIYCQTDNILRYLLRVSMPDIEPIGLLEVMPEDSKSIEPQMGKKISKKRVYEIDNINVTEFITGHLSYRFNMKTIARLIGIKDE